MDEDDIFGAGLNDDPGEGLNDDPEAVAEESADEVTTTFFERFKKNFNEAVYGDEGPKEGETRGGMIAAAALSPIDTGKALAKAFAESPTFKNAMKKFGDFARAVYPPSYKTEPKETGPIANIKNQVKNMVAPLGNFLKGGLEFLGGAKLVALEVAVRGLAAAAQKLAQTLNEINDIDERLAVINSNLAAEMQGNTEALADNTLGFGMAMKALAELRVAGFDQTNTNLIDLVSRLQISGQDTGAAINLAQSLIGTGNMQEAAVDRLAQTMIESSKAFGTSMDSVVKAVGSLSENIQRLSLMGGAETTTGITAELTAMLGPENSQLVGRLIKDLTSTTTDLNMQASLGLESVGDRLSTGQITTTELIQEITNAAIKAENLVGNAAGEGRRVLAATYGGASQTVLDLITVQEKLAEASQKQLNGQDSLLQTLTALKTIVLDPFKDAVAGMLPAFKMLVGGISYALAGILNLVTRFLSPLINLVMGAIGVIGAIVGFVADIFGGIIESLYDILSHIPLIGGLFEDASGDTNATFSNMAKITELISGTSTTNVEAASTMQSAAQDFTTMRSLSFENNALVAQTLLSSTNRNEQVIERLATSQSESLKSVLPVVTDELGNRVSDGLTTSQRNFVDAIRMSSRTEEILKGLQSVQSAAETSQRVLQSASQEIAKVSSSSKDVTSEIVNGIVKSSTVTDNLVSNLNESQREMLKVATEEQRERELVRLEKQGLERNSSVQTEAAIRFIDAAARNTTEVTDRGVESALERVFGGGVKDIIDELRVVAQTMRDQRLVLENDDL